MSRRHIVVVGIVAGIALAAPPSARASWWDIVWQMSGPQMMGPVLHCEYDFGSGETECRALDLIFYGELAPRQQRKIWLSLDTGIYFSTGKNSEGESFEAFDVWMVPFEPMLEIQSAGGTDWSLSHGLAGLSYMHFFGKDFSAFDNVGVKFRPIGVRIQKITLSWNVRFFPNGFTPDQFGVGPPPPVVDRRAEAVHGFSVGFLW